MKFVSLQSLQAAELGSPEGHGIVQLAFQRGRLLPDHITFEVPDDFPIKAEVRMQNAEARPSPLLPLPSALEEPSLLDLAANFTTALTRWTAAVCDACEHWSSTARLGLGKCNAPGCGCTGFKRWLATERCPLSKWPELLMD